MCVYRRYSTTGWLAGYTRVTRDISSHLYIWNYGYVQCSHAFFISFAVCIVVVVVVEWQKCCCSHHLLEIYYFCTNYVIKIPNEYYIFSKQLHSSALSYRTHARECQHTTIPLLWHKSGHTRRTHTHTPLIKEIIITDERNPVKEIRRATTTIAACSTLNRTGTANYDLKRTCAYVIHTDTRT